MIARRLLVAGLAVCLGAAGCGNGMSPQDPPHAPTVTARAPVPGDCGGVVLDQGESPPEAALTCLTDAADARKASRLQVTRPTVEGDAITTTYVIDEAGVVHVTEDATLDRFGDGKVHRSTCTGPGVEQGEITFEHC